VRWRPNQPRQYVITHLIDQDYNLADILVECVTYGTAGLVTTREFITMACWHLLNNDDLRARYVAADEDERLGILAEIIRLEPPVGHLYRRVTEPVTVNDREQDYQLHPGELGDLDIRQANADPDAVADEALRLCPCRERSQVVPDGGARCGAGALGSA